MKKLLSFILVIFVSFLQANHIDWTFPPTSISTAYNNASNPQVVMDDNGNIVAAWIENNFVKSSAKQVNSDWSPEATISLSGASSLQLVSDSIGNVTIVWVEHGIVKGAVKTLNGNWSSPVTLSGTGAASPVLCVDSNGDVVAAWVRNGDIETSTKLFGMNWQAHIKINGSKATYPSIAVGGSGNNTKAVIVWQDTNGSSAAIYSSTKFISGGSWSSKKVISDNLHNAGSPFVAVDKKGNALAIWYSYDIVGDSYVNVTVQSSGLPYLSANWGDLTSLSLPGIRNPNTLQAKIAFDCVGNAIALWNNSLDDETFILESSVKPLNGKWSDSALIVDSNLYAYSADLAVTSYGDVLGIYMFSNGNNLMIQSVESDINGFLNNLWTVPITISQGNNNAFPRIAAVVNGNEIHAIAVWPYYNGIYSSIVASTGSKILILPPRNLKVIQSNRLFGVFTEYYNTLSWEPSMDPNIEGYLIFRNGLFIEKVGAKTFQFEDENRTLNGSVIYTVIAIDNQQTQSKAVNVSFP